MIFTPNTPRDTTFPDPHRYIPLRRTPHAAPHASCTGALRTRAPPAGACSSQPGTLLQHLATRPPTAQHPTQHPAMHGHPQLCTPCSTPQCTDACSLPMGGTSCSPRPCSPPAHHPHLPERSLQPGLLGDRQLADQVPPRAQLLHLLLQPLGVHAAAAAGQVPHRALQHLDAAGSLAQLLLEDLRGREQEGVGAAGGPSGCASAPGARYVGCVGCVGHPSTAWRDGGLRAGLVLSPGLP